MGVFEHFPYTNYHELNFSWILRKLKELEEVIGTQIVDLVARAGVAANAQSIHDLSDTVDANAVIAHNETVTAQTTADNAVSGVATNAAAITALQNKLHFGSWTGNLTLPYVADQDGFMDVWLNPSSVNGAYARITSTGGETAMGLNAVGGNGVTLIFPVKAGETITQATLTGGSLSIRFLPMYIQ